MSDVAIRVENLSKRFVLGERVGIKTFREALQDLITTPFRRLWKPNGNTDEPKVDTDRVIWALKDVSFEVKHGEVLGIIGPNGAGKSTLLKILSRITEPTSGYAEIRGRVGSLLEVGTGFHPELTGRENVYLNGAILGMSRAEIKRKFDDIVSFAGVEKFIDTPVKRYSSGMQVRLAFAVAAHLDPEILIIDEVLAVGDAEFQKRCLGKMNEVARSGRTVLFVSHNMAAVEALCNTGLLMRAGKICAFGKVGSVIQTYRGAILASDRAIFVDLIHHRGRPPGVPALMRCAWTHGGDYSPVDSFAMGEEFCVSVEFCLHSPILPVLGLVFKTSFGSPIFAVDNRFIPAPHIKTPVSRGRMTCKIQALPLMPGEYFIDLYLGDQFRSIDRVHDALGFCVLPADVFGSGRLPSPNCGPVFQKAEFFLEEECQPRARKVVSGIK